MTGVKVFHWSAVKTRPRRLVVLFLCGLRVREEASVPGPAHLAGRLQLILNLVEILKGRSHQPHKSSGPKWIVLQLNALKSHHRFWEGQI